MEVVLRPARVEDADAMAAWFPDRAALAVWAGPQTPFPLARPAMAAWLAERDGPRPRHCWTVAEDGDLPAAHFQLGLDPACETVRIARFGVAPRHRGSGLGTELMKTMLEMAFDELGAFRVELGVASFNHGARRLYERFGFVTEGTHRAAALVDGERWSVDTMSLLRPEWAAGASPSGTGRLGS